MQKSKNKNAEPIMFGIFYSLINIFLWFYLKAHAKIVSKCAKAIDNFPCIVFAFHITNIIL